MPPKKDLSLNMPDIPTEFYKYKFIINPFDNNQFRD